MFSSVWQVRRRTISIPLWALGLLHPLLFGGSFLRLRYILNTYELIRMEEGTPREPCANIDSTHSRSLSVCGPPCSMQLPFLLSCVPGILAVLAPLNAVLCFLRSGRVLASGWVPSSCTNAWKASSGSKLGKIVVLTSFYPFSQASASCMLYHVWKPSQNFSYLKWEDKSSLLIPHGQNQFLSQSCFFFFNLFFYFNWRIIIFFLKFIFNWSLYNLHVSMYFVIDIIY